MPLPDVVSGLLLSGRPAVRIRSGTLDETPKAGFYWFWAFLFLVNLLKSANKMPLFQFRGNSFGAGLLIRSWKQRWGKAVLVSYVKDKIVLE